MKTDCPAFFIPFINHNFQKSLAVHFHSLKLKLLSATWLQKASKGVACHQAFRTPPGTSNNYTGYATDTTRIFVILGNFSFPRDKLGGTKLSTMFRRAKNTKIARKMVKIRT